MKKLLVALLAISAIFCFASCGGPDGKCDKCGKTDLVQEYPNWDNEEYCPICAAEKAAAEIQSGLLG